MELRIQNNTTIREVAEKFSKYFPFLRLEFGICHCTGEESGDGKQIFQGLYLSETSDFFKEGLLEFTPSTTISDLVTRFKTELGLLVKVYRMVNHSWTDCKVSGHLTLGQQNSMAAASCRMGEPNLYRLFL